MRLLIVVFLAVLTLVPLPAEGQDYYNLQATQTLIVRTMAQDGQGLIWLVADHTLCTYDGFSLRQFPNDLLRAAGPANCSAMTSDGRLLIGCERGLVTFDTRTHTFAADSLLAGRYIRAIVADPSAEWLGTDRGLYRNRKAVAQQQPVEILSLAVLDGVVYAGSYQGLLRYDPRADRWLPVGEGAMPLVCCLLQVPGRKELYVGTPTSIMKYNPTTDAAPQFLSAMPVVKSLCVDGAGRLMVGTDNGLYVRQADGALSHIVHDARDHTSIAGDAIWSLLTDRDHNVWIGTENGLSLSPSRQVLRVIPLPAITGSGLGNQIHCLLHDSHSRWWLGGTHGLLQVSALGQSSQHAVWYRMDQPAHHIPHNRIRAFFEHGASGLWAGGDGGLLHFDERSQQFRRVMIEGDKNQWVYGIEAGPEGTLRVTTFDGRYDIPTLPSALAQPVRTLPQSGRPDGQRTATVQTEQWTLTGEGIQIRDTLTGRQSQIPLANRFLAIYYDPASQQVVLGGADRIALIDPEATRQPQRTHTLAVTHVEINGSSEDDVWPPSSRGELRLRHFQNNLQVSFSDFDYSQGRDIAYVFSIDPERDEWLELAPGQNTIQLPNLRPGHYYLRVRERGSQAPASEQAPLLHIRILPPWYQSAWAYVAYVLLAAAVALAVWLAVRHRRRVAQERRQREQLLAQAKQKADQLAQNNQALQQQLHLQMLASAQANQELSADDQFLLRITQLVEDNIDRTDLSVSALCRLAGTSDRQLSRRLKQLTGMNTSTFVRSLRLKKAALLLHNNTFTIAEVMYMVGFTNASYFTRCFAAEHGMTPSDYQNRQSSTHSKHINS